MGFSLSLSLIAVLLGDAMAFPNKLLFGAPTDEDYCPSPDVCKPPESACVHSSSLALSGACCKFETADPLKPPDRFGMYCGSYDPTECPRLIDGSHDDMCSTPVGKSVSVYFPCPKRVTQIILKQFVYNVHYVHHFEKGNFSFSYKDMRSGDYIKIEECSREAVLDEEIAMKAFGGRRNETLNAGWDITENGEFRCNLENGSDNNSDNNGVVTKEIKFVGHEVTPEFAPDNHDAYRIEEIDVKGCN